MAENPQKIIRSSKYNENPYFQEKKGYVDLRGNDKLDKATYKVIAIVCLGIATIAISGMIYIGSKSKFIPMLYKESNEGGLTFVGYASDPLKLTNNMIGNQLVGYIEALRRVPQDLDLKNDYSKRVRMMTNPSLFDNILVNMLIERYTNNVGKAVMVTVKNVLPIGKNTWQLDWDESTSGVVLGRYKGSITFNMQKDLIDPTKLIYDPLGIVVTDVSISPELKVGQ